MKSGNAKRKRTRLPTHEQTWTLTWKEKNSHLQKTKHWNWLNSFTKTHFIGQNDISIIKPAGKRKEENH